MIYLQFSNILIIKMYADDVITYNPHNPKLTQNDLSNQIHLNIKTKICKRNTYTCNSLVVLV